MAPLFLTESSAELLATAICRQLKRDLMKMAKDIARNQTEEWLTIEETAHFLGCSAASIYKIKDTTLKGVYTKFGKQLRFPKSRLLDMMNRGELRSPNA